MYLTPAFGTVNVVMRANARRLQGVKDSWANQGWFWLKRESFWLKRESARRGDKEDKVVTKR